MDVINPVIKERYIFMTQEDQAAAIGRIVLERKKITENLILLRAEARRLGDELTTLGSFLQSQPELVIFEQQPVNVEYANRAGGRIFKQKDINADAVIKITNEIREANDQLAKVTEEARRFGV
jgi:hypothetical protein